MSTSRKAMAVVAGTFIGGGLGFYWSEIHSLNREVKKKDELEKQLKALVESRKEKESALQNK